MRPAVFFRKALQEASGGNTATISTTNIGNMSFLLEIDMLVDAQTTTDANSAGHIEVRSGDRRRLPDDFVLMFSAL